MEIGGIGKPGGLPRAGSWSLYQNGGTTNKKLPLAGAGFGGQDQLTLSLSYLEEQTQRAWELSALEQQQFESSSSGDSAALDALEEAMKILKTCSQIAASIMKGDQVPLEDLRYLMEHDIQGYQLAMAMRRPKEDPEKCKSVLPPEEQQDSQTRETASAAQASSTVSETAGGSAGGSEPSGGGETSTGQSQA